MSIVTILIFAFGFGGIAGGLVHLVSRIRREVMVRSDERRAAGALCRVRVLDAQLAGALASISKLESRASNGEGRVIHSHSAFGGSPHG